jgi:uncharacterized membrane protein YphA (DoxX/SURF4 family)
MMNSNEKYGMQKTRSLAIAFTRISFGLVWAIDAYFKWQPAFADHFVSYLHETYGGQPALIQSWLDLWIKLVSIDPHLFARIVAMGETSIAIGLLLGLFLGLYLLSAGRQYGLDRILRARLGRWKFLSSRPLEG